MKKYLFILLALLVLLGIYLYVNITPKNPPNSIPNAQKSIPVEKKTLLIEKKRIEKNKTVIPSTMKTLSKQTDVNTKFKEPQEVPMYETLNIEEALLTTKPRSNITPISAIHIDNDAMATLKPDDTLLLPNIEGSDYTLIISHVQTHANGSVSTTGYYEDEGIKYTTTITQSEKTSFIAFSSAQGLYEIETSNAVGYIYRTDAIRKQMQKPNVNDVIILPIPEKTIK